MPNFIFEILLSKSISVFKITTENFDQRAHTTNEICGSKSKENTYYFYPVAAKTGREVDVVKDGTLFVTVGCTKYCETIG